MAEDIKNVQTQNKSPTYWIAGCTWGEGKETVSKYESFISDGNWIDGWEQGSKEFCIGDYILLKTSVRSKSKFRILAIGKIIGIINNYSLKVEWLIKSKDKKQGLFEFAMSGRGYWIETLQKLKNNDVEVIDAINKILREYEEKKMALVNNCKKLLEHSRNIILHGAPGTGKTYLARQIAESMGAETCFVQFHPSYDYTDFVEGLRPVNKEGSKEIGFERKDGLFKQFCIKALKNLIDSQKNQEQLTEEKSLKDFIFDEIQSCYESYLEGNQIKELVTKNGTTYQISGLNDKDIKVYIPDNTTEDTQHLDIHINDVIKVYNALKENKDLKPKQVRTILGNNSGSQHDSYKFAIAKYLSERPRQTVNKKEEKIEKKNFVFIIDETNRGEMSKIFGELFFSIDPSYRGEKGNVLTQYANMQQEPNDFDLALGHDNDGDYGHFFVPENVYIIGTMNDIDRNVESMDFAIRRRFAFKEITAADTQDMLDNHNWGENKPDIEAMKKRMTNLNNAISGTEGLSSAYHIGASYFLKFNLPSDYKDENDTDEKKKKVEETEKKAFDNLWDYHLKPLLQEYLRGMEDADNKLKALKAAYDNDKQ